MGIVLCHYVLNKLLALATASVMRENSFFFFCQIGQRPADLEVFCINSLGKNVGGERLGPG